MEFLLYFYIGNPKSINLQYLLSMVYSLHQLSDKNSLLKHYAKLITIRVKYPEIARGTYVSLNLQENNLGGFSIDYNGETTFIVHNNSDQEISLTCEFNKLLESIGFAEATLKNKELKIGPYTSAILK